MLSFQIDFDVLTRLILQNTISRFNLFQIESLIAERVTLDGHEKNMCWMLQQETEKSIFRVIFWIDFKIMTTMILQNTISIFNFFRIESFESGVC